MVEDFRIGPLEEFPPGSKRILEVEGRSIGIYHSESGHLYAVLNVCAHALGPICLSDLKGTMLPSGPGEYVYGMEGLVLRCPWHGWEFDVRTGEALFGTDHRKLVTFPVKVEDGEVVITMQPRKRRSQGLVQSTGEADG